MRRSKSLNFLLELLFVIVLFTFCSIVFMNLFVSAAKMNQSAEIKYQASLGVQTIVENIRTNGTYEEVDEESYSIQVEKNGDDYTVVATDRNGNVLETVQVMYVE